MSPKGNITETRFEIGSPVQSANNGRIYIPSRRQYARAVECFAEGVCSELAFQMAAFPLADYERWRRHRDRLRRMTRVWRTTRWAIPAAVVPVGVVVGLVTWNPFWGIAIGCWLAALLRPSEGRDGSVTLRS